MHDRRNLRPASVSTNAVRGGALGAACFAAIIAFAFGPSEARAQGTAWTGYELALEGSPTVPADRIARVRGTAYRVRGLAELVRFSGRVRARFAWVDEGRRDGAWVNVQTDAQGRFVAEIRTPLAPATPAPARLEFEVGPEGSARTIEVPIRLRSAEQVTLYTDRRLYEPGEPVHVWALVRDAASGRPIDGESVEIAVSGMPMPPAEGVFTASNAGVVHWELEVPDDAPEGPMRVDVRVPGQTQVSTSFRVGTRTYERLFGHLTVEPETVAPGAAARVLVHLTTTSGAPVRDAAVSVTVDDQEAITGTTDAAGEATIEVTSPFYLVHSSGWVPVTAEISHPAHGSVRAFDRMHLAVPLSLRAEATPRHGALVPEIDDVLFVHVHDDLGNPPAQPTEVTVTGAAVRGGRATVTTDPNGLCEVPVRLPRGAASGDGDTPRTSVRVQIAGPLERLARLSIPVARDAEVAPTPSADIVEPGSRLDVAIARRPSANASPVVLELLGEHEQRLAVRWLPPRANRVQIDVPANVVGLTVLRARAVHDDESHEGTGAQATVLVRPPDPDFVRVEPERARWTVGETARVTLRTGAGGPARFAAVLVRDLAAHGGETAFQEAFLGTRFDQAIQAPTDEAGRRLVAAAMAAVTERDGAPREARPLVDGLGLPVNDDGTSARRTLRDPWPAARELSRRGVGAAMRALEAHLAGALEGGDLDGVTRLTGRRRALRDDLLADEDGMRTLGDGVLTPEILEAADPAFTYDHVATRVARARLVRLLVALALYLDPGDEASPAARMAAREPSSRWLARMVERGVIGAHDLDDPWGNRFALRASRNPALVLSTHATGLELASPGPDGRFGTRDDVRDPFARAVPTRTPYALASGEDALIRQLALLTATSRTLELLAEAYRRVSAEMREEEIGDAVAAETSEGTIGLGNLGTIGHGGGGGSGSGYGHGGLGLRQRRSPRVRTGSARGLGSIAALVRERFPPTLLFRPSLVVDPSGTTEVSIPLADAVTTYLVEAIVWREDGWITSGRTRIEVDRDVVVEAPVPPIAHRGDVVRLPLRVANRGAEARTLAVHLEGDEALGVASTDPVEVTVPAGDAVVVPIELRPAQVGEGRLTAVVSGGGEPVDAVRRPMRVIAPARRVELERTRFARGRGRVLLTVPTRADAREGAVEVVAGPALFGGEGAAPWAHWIGPGVDTVQPVERALRTSMRRQPAQLAFAIGRAWSDDGVSDAQITRFVERLTRELDNQGRRDDELARERLTQLQGWALLGLAPALAGGREVQALDDLVIRLREQVAAGALARDDDPQTAAVAAAALAWTARDESGREEATELARRLSRSAVEVGPDRWLATERRPVRSTILHAMTEVALGRERSAFALLGTVARWADRESGLRGDERGLARAALRRLTSGAAPEEVTVTVDGESQTLLLEDGSGVLAMETLAAPGRHEIAIDARGAPVLVRARARYGMPWDVAPEERGPLTLSIEGETGDLDDTAELELTVRNRAPRTLRRPLVEIELPTGAELTERDRARMADRRVRVERGGGVLTLHLPPMRPGNELTVPLPLRWGVAGELLGLGVSAYSADRPEAATVLAPRTLEIEGGAP